MRLTALVLVLMAAPALASAQGTLFDASAPRLPSIGLPLPPIGLPLPALGLPPAGVSRPPAISPPPGRGDHGGRHHGRNHRRPAVVIVPAFGWGLPGRVDRPIDARDHYESRDSARESPSTGDRETEAEATVGTVRLDVDFPPGAQLFVDGYFVGTPVEIGNELEIEAGPHRIEIRAPGYETLVIDVRVTAGRSITYRGALERPGGAQAPAPAPPEPAADAPVPATVYFIPGCYLGNVPPQGANLPDGCDLGGLTTFQP